jgi:hypothetical protein
VSTTNNNDKVINNGELKYDWKWTKSFGNTK